MWIAANFIRHTNMDGEWFAAQPSIQEKKMRVMVVVKVTGDSETGAMPTTEELAEMGRFNEGLIV